MSPQLQVSHRAATGVCQAGSSSKGSAGEGSASKWLALSSLVAVG